jgi:hypothetical protein
MQNDLEWPGCSIEGSMEVWQQAEVAGGSERKGGEQSPPGKARKICW